MHGGAHQARGRRRERHELPQRQAGHRRHHPRIPPMRAPEAKHGLGQSKATGERQGEVTKFGNHDPAFAVTAAAGACCFQ